MQTKLLSFLCISCFVLVQSTPIGYFTQEFFDTGNADAFVDQVLTAAKAQYGATLDPFHVPDSDLKFSKKLGILTLSGEAKLTEGTITGLSHLKRSGESTIGTENNHFVAHIEVGDDNIKIHYKVDATFMNLFHPKLTLESEVGNIDIKAAIGVDADGKPVLNELHIEELQHVKIYVHGLGLLDPLIDLIGDAFIEFFNPTARDLLSNLLKGMLGDVLKNFKLPGTAFY
jgi:hypothetical protein